MYAIKLLHKKIQTACPSIHATRLHCLMSATDALIKGQRLTLTDIGRSLSSNAYVKHNIKRVDRLIGNSFLHSERQSIYAALATLLLNKQPRPLIIVDWSDLATANEAQLLRASLPIGGRAITLYEEVHPIDRLDNPKIHRAFLKRVRNVLPEGCKPIVITDAGFRNTWFNSVVELGWDWVGRIRNRTLFKLENEDIWLPCKSLYEQATTKAKYIGKAQIAKSNPIGCHLYLVRKKNKGRTYHVTSTNQRVKSAQREREPWLLASSLAFDKDIPNKVVAYYKSRMQIEEAFRDTKSVRYGFCFRHTKSTQIERLQILLLIATLAIFSLLLIGWTVETKRHHYRFQVNSITHRKVLSTFYLGCMVVTSNYLLPTHKELLEALKSLQDRVRFNEIT